MRTTSTGAALLFLAVSHVASAAAQEAPTPPVATLATPMQRAAAFDRAFFQAANRCDLKTLSAMTAPDLEFFHDLAGTMRGRAAFLEATEKNVCGKFTRAPVPGSMEAWTLGKEGLIYSGTHHFCHAGKTGCQGSGRYLHVLTESNGALVLARVVSYDHRALE